MMLDRNVEKKARRLLLLATGATAGDERRQALLFGEVCSHLAWACEELLKLSGNKPPANPAVWASIPGERQ